MLLGGHESTVAMLRLAGTCDACKTLSVIESLKVSNRFVESALCDVDPKDHTCFYLLVHNFYQRLALSAREYT